MICDTDLDLLINPQPSPANEGGNSFTNGQNLFYLDKESKNYFGKSVKLYYSLSLGSLNNINYLDDK